jgi:ABC-type transport system substrate-binding protein
MQQGEATFDQNQRAAAYQQAMQAFNDEPFALYLTSLSALYGVAGRVDGFKPSASGYLYVTDLTVK